MWAIGAGSVAFLVHRELPDAKVVTGYDVVSDRLSVRVSHAGRTESTELSASGATGEPDLSWLKQVIDNLKDEGAHGT